MEIELQSLIPIPLKDRLSQRSSDVWNNNILFTSKEWLKIKAPSGTGKTTLIHLLYKLRNDYSGNIFWNKKDIKNIHGDELADLRKQKISIVFQDLRLFPHLTARENIELKRILHKPIYEKNKINEMAENLGVTSILEQRAGLCSYGEQQRIAIIRSLMQPFEILLMDEPFSHLDNANTAKCATLIEEECVKQNAGFIITDLDDDDNFNYSKKITL